MRERIAHEKNKEYLTLSLSLFFSLAHNQPMFRLPKKKALVILILAFISLFCFANGKRNVATEHFLIIYDDESENVAYEIFSFCEESYRTLVSFFSEDPDLHMPVYIEKEEKVFNAYFTSYPYNRIVVNAAPVSASLDNSSNPLEMTFLHELAHAFTFSFKGKLAEATTSMFGDWANFPVSLHMLYYMQEGIAVYAESRDGGGRLNDPFAMAPLLEAKIEGKDVSYADASGGRDILPGATMWYIYGGAFSEWMAEKYGEKDLSNYYKKIAKNLFSFPQNTYSSLFSTSLNSDWNRFFQEIKVPESLREGESVASSSRSYSCLNVLSGVLYALSSSEEALLKVGEDKKDEKVFSYYSSTEDLAVGEDGTFLLPNVFGSVERMERYDRDGKLIGKWNGYSDGTFFLDGYLFFSTKDTVSSLVYIDSMGEETTIDLGKGVVAHEFVTLPDGAAFLLTRDGKEYIATLSSSLGVSLFDTPCDMLFSSLSASSGILSFSWAQKGGEGEMGKYGEIDLSSGDLYLSREEYKGGVNYPVRDGDTVCFVSERFDQSRIMKDSIDSFRLSLEGKALLVDFEPRGREDISFFNSISHKYNPLSTMTKGALLPVYYYTGSFLPDSDTVGLSWITMDGTENVDFLLSGGFAPSISSYTMSGRIRKGNVGATISATRGKDHFSYEANLGLSLSFPLSHMGEKIETSDILGWVSLDGEGQWINYFSLLYSNKRQNGIGRFNVLGFESLFEMVGLSPSLTFTLNLPGPIPRPVLSMLDYSLPSSVSLYLDRETLVAEEMVHLITLEVQKGVRFLSLYFRDFELYAKARETYGFSDSSFLWDAAVGMKVVLSPVLGSLSRNYMEIGFELGYNEEKGIIPSLVLGVEI